MAKPFDATTKFLVETHPADWVKLLGFPYGEAKLLDTDLSTVTAAADTLLRLQLYRALVRRENPRLAIACALILLRPFAGHRALTGLYQEHGPEGEIDSFLRYHVLRVWELAPEIFLEGDSPRSHWPSSHKCVRISCRKC